MFVSTLCKYDLRKGDLFVASWARGRVVCLWSVYYMVLIDVGGGV